MPEELQKARMITILFATHLQNKKKTVKPSLVATGVSLNQLGVKLAVRWSGFNFFPYQKTIKGKEKCHGYNCFCSNANQIYYFFLLQTTDVSLDTSQHLIIPNVYIQTEQKHLSGTWGKRPQPELHQTKTNPYPWLSVPQDELCRM